MDPEEYEFEEPKPKKVKLKKELHADFVRRVREAVLTADEDWLTSRFLSQSLRGGEKHVVEVLSAMAGEGVLSPLQPVPYDEEVKVGVRPIADGFFHVNAFRHADRWVVGYFSKSVADARKTVLVHGKPDYSSYRHLGVSRARTRYRRRTPTLRMEEDFRNSFRYKAADWDGLAHRVLRNGQPFIDACLALGIEPKTDLPWTCGRCGRKNEASHAFCHYHNCSAPRPKYLKPPEPKKCPDCGEPDVDGHSRRHRGRKLKASRTKCLQKMVDKVHRM